MGFLGIQASTKKNLVFLKYPTFEGQNRLFSYFGYHSKECLSKTPLLILLAFNASPSLPLESKNLGLSGKKTRATVTSAAGRPQMATKMRQELNLNPPSASGLSMPSLLGMMAQARPATVTLPIIQKAAKADSIRPRRDAHWNSAKYDHTRGILPPTLFKIE